MDETVASQPASDNSTHVLPNEEGGGVTGNSLPIPVLVRKIRAFRAGNDSSGNHILPSTPSSAVLAASRSLSNSPQSDASPTPLSPRNEPVPSASNFISANPSLPASPFRGNSSSFSHSLQTRPPFPSAYSKSAVQQHIGHPFSPPKAKISNGDLLFNSVVFEDDIQPSNKSGDLTSSKPLVSPLPTATDVPVSSFPTRTVKLLIVLLVLNAFASWIFAIYSIHSHQQNTLAANEIALLRSVLLDAQRASYSSSYSSSNSNSISSSSSLQSDLGLNDTSAVRSFVIEDPSTGQPQLQVYSSSSASAASSSSSSSSSSPSSENENYLFAFGSAFPSSAPSVSSSSKLFATRPSPLQSHSSASSASSAIVLRPLVDEEDDSISATTVAIGGRTHSGPFRLKIQSSDADTSLALSSGSTSDAILRLRGARAAIVLDSTSDSSTSSSSQSSMRVSFSNGRLQIEDGLSSTSDPYFSIHDSSTSISTPLSVQNVFSIDAANSAESITMSANVKIKQGSLSVSPDSSVSFNGNVAFSSSASVTISSPTTLRGPITIGKESHGIQFEPNAANLIAQSGGMNLTSPTAILIQSPSIQAVGSLSSSKLQVDGSSSFKGDAEFSGFTLVSGAGGLSVSAGPAKIGAGGLLVDGTSKFTGSISVEGQTLLRGGLQINSGGFAVNSIASFSAGLAVLGGPTSVAGSLLVSGPASMSSMSVSGPATLTQGLQVVSGSLSVSESTVLNGVITLGGPTSFNAAVEFKNDVKLSSSLNLGGDTTFSGRTSFTNHTDFSNTVSMSAPLVINSNTTIGGNALFTGPLTLNSSVTVNGPMVVSNQMRIDGSLFATGSTIFNGSLSVSSNFSLTGSAYFSGPLIADKGVTANGPSLFNQSVVIGSDISVTGRTILSGPMTLNSSLVITGNMSTSSSSVVTFSGPTQFQSGIINNGTFYSSGPLVTSSDLQVNGSLVLAGNLTVSSSVQFKGTDTVISSQNLIISSNSTRISSPMILQGPITSNSSLIVNSDFIISSNGSMQVNAPALFQSGIALQGPLTSSGPISLSGSNFSVSSSVLLNGNDTTISSTSFIISSASATITSPLLLQGPVTSNGSLSVNGPLIVASAGTSFDLQNTPPLISNGSCSILEASSTSDIITATAGCLSLVPLPSVGDTVRIVIGGVTQDTLTVLSMSSTSPAVLQLNRPLSFQFNATTDPAISNLVFQKPLLSVTSPLNDIFAVHPSRISVHSSTLSLSASSKLTAFGPTSFQIPDATRFSVSSAPPNGTLDTSFAPYDILSINPTATLDNQPWCSLANNVIVGTFTITVSSSCSIFFNTSDTMTEISISLEDPAFSSSATFFSSLYTKPQPLQPITIQLSSSVTSVFTSNTTQVRILPPSFIARSLRFLKSSAPNLVSFTSSIVSTPGGIGLRGPSIQLLASSVQLVDADNVGTITVQIASPQSGVVSNPASKGVDLIFQTATAPTTSGRAGDFRVYLAQSSDSTKLNGRFAVSSIQPSTVVSQFVVSGERKFITTICTLSADVAVGATSLSLTGGCTAVFNIFGILIQINDTSVPQAETRMVLSDSTTTTIYLDRALAYAYLKANTTISIRFPEFEAKSYSTSSSTSPTAGFYAASDYLYLRSTSYLIQQAALTTTISQHQHRIPSTATGFAFTIMNSAGLTVFAASGTTGWVTTCSLINPAVAGDFYIVLAGCPGVFTGLIVTLQQAALSSFSSPILRVDASAGAAGTRILLAHSIPTGHAGFSIGGCSISLRGPSIFTPSFSYDLNGWMYVNSKEMHLVSNYIRIGDNSLLTSPVQIVIPSRPPWMSVTSEMDIKVITPTALIGTNRTGGSFTISLGSTRSPATTTGGAFKITDANSLDLLSITPNTGFMNSTGGCTLFAAAVVGNYYLQLSAAFCNGLPFSVGSTINIAYNGNVTYFTVANVQPFGAQTILGLTRPVENAYTSFASAMITVAESIVRLRGMLDTTETSVFALGGYSASLFATPSSTQDATITLASNRIVLGSMNDPSTTPVQILIPSDSIYTGLSRIGRDAILKLSDGFGMRGGRLTVQLSSTTSTSYTQGQFLVQGPTSGTFPVLRIAGTSSWMSPTVAGTCNLVAPASIGDISIIITSNCSFSEPISIGMRVQLVTSTVPYVITFMTISPPNVTLTLNKPLEEAYTVAGNIKIQYPDFTTTAYPAGGGVNFSGRMTFSQTDFALFGPEMRSASILADSLVFGGSNPVPKIVFLKKTQVTAGTSLDIVLNRPGIADSGFLTVRSFASSEPIASFGTTDWQPAGFLFVAASPPLKGWSSAKITGILLPSPYAGLLCVCGAGATTCNPSACDVAQVFNPSFPVNSIRFVSPIPTNWPVTSALFYRPLDVHIQAATTGALHMLPSSLNTARLALGDSQATIIADTATITARMIYLSSPEESSDFLKFTEFKKLANSDGSATDLKITGATAVVPSLTPAIDGGNVILMGGLSSTYNAAGARDGKVMLSALYNPGTIPPASMTTTPVVSVSGDARFAFQVGILANSPSIGDCRCEVNLASGASIAAGDVVSIKSMVFGGLYHKAQVIRVNMAPTPPWIQLSNCFFSSFFVNDEVWVRDSALVINSETKIPAITVSESFASMLAKTSIISGGKRLTHLYSTTTAAITTTTELMYAQAQAYGSVAALFPLSTLSAPGGTPLSPFSKLESAFIKITSKTGTFDTMLICVAATNCGVNSNLQWDNDVVAAFPCGSCNIGNVLHARLGPANAIGTSPPSLLIVVKTCSAFPCTVTGAGAGIFEFVSEVSTRVLNF